MLSTSTSVKNIGTLSISVVTQITNCVRHFYVTPVIVKIVTSVFDGNGKSYDQGKLKATETAWTIKPRSENLLI